MKLKTTVLAIVLGAGATSAFASNFNGFVGLAGGADFFTENRNVTDTPPGAASSTTAFANDSTGFAGDLKLGGTYTSGKFTMGLVGDALAQTGKADLKYSYHYDNSSGASHGLPDEVSSKGYESMPFSFGLSLMPALNVSENSAIYLVAGARLGQFKSHLPSKVNSDPTQTTNSSFGTNTAYNGDISKWVAGFDAGLGFTSYFTRHFSMEGQYDYTYYLPFTEHTKFGDGSGTQAQFHNVAIKYTPFTSRITLALSYHFAPMAEQRAYAHPLAWLNSLGINVPNNSRKQEATA